MTPGVREHNIKKKWTFPCKLFIRAFDGLYTHPFLSKLSFEQHLQDLFDVIVALNTQTVDLLRFQLFVHHRAFQKLGERVRNFSTLWDQSPFDILSDNPDTELKKKKFTFKHRDSEFHTLIQSYVSAEPNMCSTVGSNSVPIYSVGVTNAPQWIRALKQLWLRLQACLLDGSTTELQVKNESPSTHVVNDIITILFVLEALTPAFKHIVSSRRAAHALANAGAFKGP